MVFTGNNIGNSEEKIKEIMKQVFTLLREKEYEPGEALDALVNMAVSMALMMEDNKEEFLSYIDNIWSLNKEKADRLKKKSEKGKRAKISTN